VVDTDVLVVGAGPVGLPPAAELAEPNTAQQAGAPDAADRHKILVESPEELFFQD
jgi:hypothetical protein